MTEAATNTRRDLLRVTAAGGAIAATGLAGTALAEAPAGRLAGKTAPAGRLAGKTAPAGLLAGKTALVTGAARGIGRAIAETYAREGASVVMLDLADPDALPPVEGFRTATAEEFAEAAASVAAITPNVVQVRGDVRRPDDLDAAVARAVERFGGLDIAVANAGYVRWHSFADGTAEDWQSVLDVNVTGVFDTFRAAIPALRARGGGRLIALSSIGGRQGVPGNGAYTASKWAVNGLVKQAAIELGPEHITVNAIAPGPVNTAMYRSEGQIRSMGLDSAAEQDAAANPMLPLGDRPAMAPEEIAEAAVFLASDGAGVISGVSLDVALGYNAHYTA
ncbi:MAG: SDR family oxidoreductase [Paracoccaceae bacterium]